MTYKDRMDNAILSTISTEQSKRNLREWNPYHPPAYTPLVFSSVVFHQIVHEKGLSFPKVADRANLSHSFVSAISKGVSNPTYATIKKLASAVGVSPDAFMVITDFE